MIVLYTADISTCRTHKEFVQLTKLYARQGIIHTRTVSTERTPNAYMHTCIHAYMHTCIHAYLHTFVPTTRIVYLSNMPTYYTIGPTLPARRMCTYYAHSTRLHMIRARAYVTWGTTRRPAKRRTDLPNIEVAHFASH